MFWSSGTASCVHGVQSAGVGGGVAHCHYLWLAVTIRLPLSFFELGLGLLCTKKQAVGKWYLRTHTSKYIKIYHSRECIYGAMVVRSSGIFPE